MNKNCLCETDYACEAHGKLCKDVKQLNEEILRAKEISIRLLITQRDTYFHELAAMRSERDSFAAQLAFIKENICNESDVKLQSQRKETEVISSLTDNQCVGLLDLNLGYIGATRKLANATAQREREDICKMPFEKSIDTQKLWDTWYEHRDDPSGKSTGPILERVAKVAIEKFLSDLKEGKFE